MVRSLKAVLSGWPASVTVIFMRLAEAVRKRPFSALLDVSARSGQEIHAGLGTGALIV